jgi:HD superfamily phosphohydrolase
MDELIGAAWGADVLDYIDRDSLHCGLEHRVDSAIYRHFHVGASVRGDPTSRHLVSAVYGRHGFRLDAEFALESVLRERFALFLKVYTHPTKIAAGAMLGKAVSEELVPASKRKGNALHERSVEWMGDAELVLRLRESSKPQVKSLAEGFLERRLYRSAFRSNALAPNERGTSQYEARRSRFSDLGLLSPTSRLEHEATIARKSGLKPGEIIIYCPSAAPGLQRVRHYVSTKPGKAEYRDEAHDPHLRMLERHLGLWFVYVFVSPSCDRNEFNKAGEAAEEVLGLGNEIRIDRKQLVLPF